jgi:hypothetical protein
LHTSRIAVPPFEADYLRRGHAVHFRCQRPDTDEMRLDVMAVMRGVAPFQELWERRTSVEVESGIQFELLGLGDLVRAKKTQRDKDWVMIRRMLARHYRRYQASPSEEQVRFWLREGRTPQMVQGVAKQFSTIAAEVAHCRPLIEFAIAEDAERLAQSLHDEEQSEHDDDRVYWTPLKAELEQLRMNRRR